MAKDPKPGWNPNPFTQQDMDRARIMFETIEGKMRSSDRKTDWRGIARQAAALARLAKKIAIQVKE